MNTERKQWLSLNCLFTTCYCFVKTICRNKPRKVLNYIQEKAMPAESTHFLYYHPRMRLGNVFGHVCKSVCLSVFLSVFLSVQAIIFELLDKETSFLVCWYILTISRSSLSIMVIGSRSKSYGKNDSFTYFNLLILCMWL